MGLIGELRLQNAKRHLQSQLKEIVELAEGHKSADLPAGHKYYVTLKAKAGEAIKKFQDRQASLGVPVTDYDEIAAGVPTLKMLDSLAEGLVEANKNAKRFLAVLVAGALFAILLGLYHDLYLLVTHFANVRWGH